MNNNILLYYMVGSLSALLMTNYQINKTLESNLFLTNSLFSKLRKKQWMKNVHKSILDDFQCLIILIDFLKKVLPSTKRLNVDILSFSFLKLLMFSHSNVTHTYLTE